MLNLVFILLLGGLIVFVTARLLNQQDADPARSRRQWASNPGWSPVDWPLAQVPELKGVSKAERRAIYGMAYEEFNREHRWVQFLFPVLAGCGVAQFNLSTDEAWIRQHIPGIGPIPPTAIVFVLILVATIALALVIQLAVFLRLRHRFSDIIQRQRHGLSSSAR
jgi:hypothetical protein